MFRVRANGDGGAWAVPEAQLAFRSSRRFDRPAGSTRSAARRSCSWPGARRTRRAWILNRQFAATLAERTRLSREIHDTMLQSLAGIALQVQAIARQCAPHASEQQAQLLALRREVEEHVREARQAIMNLRSPMLEARGLAGALAEIGRRAVAAPACFDMTADQIAGASLAVEGELLRIGQEAIANAARHAAATRIHVDLQQERGNRPAACDRRWTGIRCRPDDGRQQRSLRIDRHAGTSRAYGRTPHRHEFGRRHGCGGERPVRSSAVVTPQPMRPRAPSPCSASTIIASSAKASG